MLWETSAETQTIDGIEYRNVWKRVDAAVIRDADALGARVTPPGKEVRTNFWSKDLCVVAYDGEDAVALAPGEIRYADRLKANMAFLRVFVAPSHRQRGIVVPLCMKAHEVMRRYSLDTPHRRIGGTMGFVTVKGVMDEPVTKAFMHFIGYTPQDAPLLVRWFEHYTLPAPTVGY